MKISWPTLLLLLGASLALLQPKWGVEEDAVRAQGIDLLICLDVSRSMLARDIAPNRLQRAKLEIEDLLSAMTTDRVGLILVAGEAQRATPLTNDFSNYRAILRLASPESVFQGGTNLASALAMARELLEAAPSLQRNVVLISDGEDRSGEVQQQIELCKEAGVQVFTLGMGTLAGSKITLADADGVEFFLADQAGVEVVSKYDADSLARIAVETGGMALNLRSEVGVLSKCYREVLLPRAIQAAASDADFQRANRFQIFLGIGMLGAIFGLAGCGRRRR